MAAREGIDAYRNVIIEGGTVFATATDDEICGIRSREGSITISGGAKVTVTAASEYGSVIFAPLNEIKISGKDTVVTAESCTYGIRAQSNGGITITDAEVNASNLYVDEGATLISGARVSLLEGIDSDGDITISDGSYVTAGPHYYGCIATEKGSFVISGKDTFVKTGGGREGLFGNSVKIEEATVEIASVGDSALDYECSGIGSYRGGIEITNAKVTVTAEGTGDMIVEGITARIKDLIITDSKVTVTVKGENGRDSALASQFGNVVFSGSKTVVTAKGTSTAVFSQKGITITPPLMLLKPADGYYGDTTHPDLYEGKTIFESDGTTVANGVLIAKPDYKAYTVTWIIDGRAETETYSYGETPTHATPHRASDTMYSYTFTGWNPAIVPVTEDAVYTAQFEKISSPFSPLNPFSPFNPYNPNSPFGPQGTTPGSGSPDGTGTSDGSGTHRDKPLPFTDVTPDSPFFDDIRYVYENDIMNGMSETTFGENLPLTRGMIVTILHRVEGRPAVTYTSAFTDVPDGMWYTDGVEWAASRGIVLGYGNGKYGPDDNVTRKQLAAILFRYAKVKGYDVSVGEDTNILSYYDAFTWGDWAVSALQWACGTGVLEDSPVGMLRPTDDATRGEIARAIHVFCEKVAK